MILLDTHVLLWLLATPERIGHEARTAIAEESRVCFSAVSIVETAIKQMIGRLEVPDDLPGVLEEQGLEAIPLRAGDGLAIAAFPELARHDPFDRMLLAQAHAHEARFLTADRRLLELGLGWVLNVTS